jgi:hypothetical protein
VVEAGRSSRHGRDGCSGHASGQEDPRLLESDLRRASPGSRGRAAGSPGSCCRPRAEPRRRYPFRYRLESVDGNTRECRRYPYLSHSIGTAEARLGRHPTAFPASFASRGEQRRSRFMRRRLTLSVRAGLKARCPNYGNRPSERGQSRGRPMKLQKRLARESPLRGIRGPPCRNSSQ